MTKIGDPDKVEEYWPLESPVPKRKISTPDNPASVPVREPARPEKVPVPVRRERR